MQRTPHTPSQYQCLAMYSLSLSQCLNTVTIEALPEPTDGSSSPLTWILAVLIVVLIVGVVIFTVVVVV